MADTYQTILVGAAEGVLTITLNRPDAMNAYSAAMSSELQAALKNAARDSAVRCVVITGAGRAFCAGQDLAEIKGSYTGEKPPLDFGAHLRKHYTPLVKAIRTLEKPTIASINGVAAGAGASFALACDLRIAGKSASLMMAFVNIGLIPDSAATLTLVQHAGYGRAAELCLLGEKLPAEEAHRWGLINRVVEDAELPAATTALATKLAALPARALALTKRTLVSALRNTLDEQLEYEAFAQATAGATKDHVEGVRAFLEKRKPTFTGA
ncbi:MAG: enoyl-CoA hydratase-related protein [Phycisphaerae bacterium]|nr:enoyl-CoA hydratase-related protein [Phycisphaerae bacterium]